MGTDAAGRRQYLYHEQFRAEQEKAKHEHVRQVARALPELRAQVAADLGGRGLSRDRVTACAVRLLDLGFFRVGSDRHTCTSETYGLTTMLREHVSCRRDEVMFSFPAKGGVETVAVVTHGARATDAARRRQTARAVREVSHYLGNTPAVCRTSYIDPKVFELFEQGVTITPVLTRLGEHGDFGRPATQGAVEAAVLDLLDGSGG